MSRNNPNATEPKNDDAKAGETAKVDTKPIADPKADTKPTAGDRKPEVGKEVQLRLADGNSISAKVDAVNKEVATM